MGLILPVPTVTSGPTYAFQEQTAFTTIDAHDHTPGKGPLVPVAGINVNADFPFQSFNATLLRTARFSPLITPPALGTDLGCLSAVNGDLYYNNGTGFPVQITAGNGINATSIGGIGGDYATSPASVFYTQISALFTFWQNTNQSAKIDAGPITIRKTTVASPGVTLQAPAALAGSYGITFPLANPASTKLVGWTSTGQLLPAYDVDNTTIEFDGSSNLRVKDQGITASKIVNDVVLNGNIATTGNLQVGDALSDSLKVGGTSGIRLYRDSMLGTAALGLDDSSLNNIIIAPRGVANAGIQSLSSKAMGVSSPADGGSLAIVTGSTSTTALRVIRGSVNGTTGGIVSGEGFTVSHPSAGTYVITYTLLFSGPAVVTVTPNTTGTIFTAFPQLQAEGSGNFQLKMWDSVLVVTPRDSGFSFIAIGPR